MFKEILQIIPKLSSSELNNMERSLQSRFMKVAKSFGTGLKNVLTGGSIVGAAAALLQKALSPLKEIEEAINRTLDKGNDLTTGAKQFNTTPGEFAKLTAIAAAKGLDAGSLEMLLIKFQTAVAEAKADPKKDTSVRQFVGEGNTVEGFLKFIQGVQKLSTDKQVLVQQEVFGAKQIGKMSDFLNADFPKLIAAFANVKTDSLTRDINKLSGVSDVQRLLGAQTQLADIRGKAKNINSGTAVAMDEAERARLDRENKKIADFRGLIAVDEKMAVIQDRLETITRELLVGIPQIMDGFNVAIDLLQKAVDGWKMIFDLLKESRLLKGLLKWGK